MNDHVLAAKVWRLGLVRGTAALGLGAWVLAVPPASLGMLTRALAVYWVVDGLVVFGGSLAASLTLNRMLLFLRALAGIITALVLLGLPLASAFGPWQPGQLILLLFVPAVLGRGIGAVGALGGLAVIVGALRLRPTGDHSLSALPH